MPGRRGDCMRRATRRQFVRGVGAAGLALLGGCGRLPWQAPPANVARIGYLSLQPSTAPVANSTFEAFVDGLRHLGYVDGRDITIEQRWADNQIERLPDLATELVRLPVDLIVASGIAPIRAAMEATSTIPIVMATASEPVTSGLVSGLARPGGNVTGVSNLASQLTGKRLELLKETAPIITRVAFLWNPALPDRAFEFPEADAAARALELELRPLAVREAREFDGAFAQAMGERVQALVLQENALNQSHQARIAEFATQSRLPSIGGNAAFAGAGGLMSYGPNLPDRHRRAAYYVDRILKGAKPADLPVEQPQEFEFAINLKTAQALGLTIPEHVLL